MKIIFLLVDGLGVGDRDSAINPCAQDGILFFNNFQGEDERQDLPFAGRVALLDAGLGVPGLPQSATGQTTLLTGINAAALLGRHLNGFPNQKLREVVAKKSILKQFIQRGQKVAFLNAYRPLFFTLPEHQRWKLSTTTVANLAAGLPFFQLRDVVEEKCLYQDFTNRELVRRGYKIPIFTPGKAGEILAKAAQEYDFCLFEYFQTDRAGHAMDMKRGVRELEKLEEFLTALLSTIDLRTTLVVLVSDHGNIEDLSVKGHTTNPATALLWGQASTDIAARITSIQHVTPNILEICH